MTTRQAKKVLTRAFRDGVSIHHPTWKRAIDQFGFFGMWHLWNCYMPDWQVDIEATQPTGELS